MPTPLLWEVTSLIVKSQSFLCKIPIGWNHSSKKFTFRKRKSWRDYLFWYFIVFFIDLGVSCGASLYNILRQRINPQPHVRFLDIIMCYFVIAVGCFVSSFAMFFTIRESDTEVGINALNWLIQFHGEMEETQRGKTVIS